MPGARGRFTYVSLILGAAMSVSAFGAPASTPTGASVISSTSELYGLCEYASATGRSGVELAKSLFIPCQ
jgi:hypothetical protein